MLIDVSIKNLDSTTSLILSAIKKEPIRELHDGIYLCPHSKFESCVEEKLIRSEKNLIVNGNQIGNNGVVDSIGQFRDLIASQLHESSTKYVCALTHVLKESQPSKAGWSWNKFGSYIGVKQPQHDYLYDESSDFKEVYVFTVFEVYDTRF